MSKFLKLFKDVRSLVTLIVAVAGIVIALAVAQTYGVLYSSLLAWYENTIAFVVSVTLPIIIIVIFVIYRFIPKEKGIPISELPVGKTILAYLCEKCRNTFDEPDIVIDLKDSKAYEVCPNCKVELSSSARKIVTSMEKPDVVVSKIDEDSRLGKKLVQLLKDYRDGKITEDEFNNEQAKIVNKVYKGEKE